MMSRLQESAREVATTLILAAGLTAGLGTSSLFCQAADVILIKPTVAMNSTGQNDVQRLKQLAGGVGCDTIANPPAYARLKTIGITTMRVINVDIAGAFTKKGRFIIDAPVHFKKKWQINRYNVTQGQQGRLREELAACRQIGAVPNVVMALALPPQICLPLRDIPPAQRDHVGDFGPTNWRWYRHYCQAFFKYVMIDQKFSNAEFSVGNEPETPSSSFIPHPPWPAPGSRAAYDDYFKMYEETAHAAQSLEKKHPGLHVSLGPALVWAFTFRFGAFNWTPRFFHDCARQKIKLDFFGIHFYGNASSLDGQYRSSYPSLADMLRMTVAARDRYCPGVPIYMTEWGPSYQAVSYSGSNIGAAWSAAFLDTLLQCGVTKAFYLLSTDDLAPQGNGYRNVWGWMGLLTNPIVCSKAYPRGQVVRGGIIYPTATAHVFEMIHRLVGTRVEASRGSSATVNCFASADRGRKRLTVLVWNYGCRLPEGAVGPHAYVDYATREAVVLRVRDARAFFGCTHVRFKRWLVSHTVSNAYYLMRHGRLNPRDAALQQVDDGSFRIIDGKVDIGFAMPPSSVSFVEIEAPANKNRQ